VFFRAKTLPLAWDYCLSMVGLNQPQPGTALIHGVLYDSYHVAVLLIAGVIAFAGTQSWDFTRRLPPWKATVVFALLIVSVLMLWTQTANPFLYFQF